MVYRCHMNYNTWPRGVLKEDKDLSKGLGMPDLQLALCLGEWQWR